MKINMTFEFYRFKKIFELQIFYFIRYFFFISKSYERFDLHGLDLVELLKNPPKSGLNSKHIQINNKGKKLSLLSLKKRGRDLYLLKILSKRGNKFFLKRKYLPTNYISQLCLSISRKWKEILLYPSTIKGKQLFLRKEKLFFLPTIINEEVKFFFEKSITILFGLLSNKRGREAI